MSQRGRVRPWRTEEDAYLRENYSLMETEAIAFYLRRTIQSVWQRAKRTGLARPNSGHFKSGNVPANKKPVVPVVPRKTVFDMCVEVLEQHDDMTILEMAAALNIKSTAVGKAMSHREPGYIYICRWEKVGHVYVGHYKAGDKPSVLKPNTKPKAKPLEEKVVEEIPVPTEFLWGIAISTNAARVAAERI